MLHISLLRGINVSGQKKIKMADLRELFERMGFAGARTYIQSGNVVFAADGGERRELEQTIEAGIKKAYEFDVPVRVRTHQELDAVITGCPFEDLDLTAEGSRVGVVFLSGEPAARQVQQLAESAQAHERLVARGSELFLYCPGGFGKTKLTNVLLERTLGLSATTRNWRTVVKLHEMSAGG